MWCNIGGKNTKELILQAISNLNAECEEKLGKLANVVPVMYVNRERSKFETRQLFCEDTRLPIGYAGAPYLALAVGKGSVPELTRSLLQVWIEFCASVLDLSTYKPHGVSLRRSCGRTRRESGQGELVRETLRSCYALRQLL